MMVKWKHLCNKIYSSKNKKTPHLIKTVKILSVSTEVKLVCKVNIVKLLHLYHLATPILRQKIRKPKINLYSTFNNKEKFSLIHLHLQLTSLPNLNLICNQQSQTWLIQLAFKKVQNQTKINLKKTF
jgi:hypothetical protein